MAEKYHRETHEFYEAMPAAMDNMHLTNDEALDAERIGPNLLPWLLVPALALLAIILFSAGSKPTPSGLNTTGATTVGGSATGTVSK